MGWFPIAFIIGFLGFWRWREWSTWSRQTRSLWLVALVLIILVLTGIAIGYVCKYSTPFLFDWIGQGLVGRILLGLLLGIATAYVVERRSAVHAAHLKILETAAHQRRATAVSGKELDYGMPEGIAGASLTGTLWIAVVVVLFAIAAPHLDGWLRRVTSLKTPFGELQIASISSQRLIAADSLDVFADELTMEILSHYDEPIRMDAEYLRKVEIPDLERRSSQGLGSSPALERELERQKKVASDADELLAVFKGLISPIADCVYHAVRGGLAIDSVRQQVRPIANALYHILAIEGGGGKIPDGSYNDSHNLFWNELQALPKKVEPFLTTDKQGECAKIVPGYQTGNGRLPEIRKYKDMPYLYVAALLFTALMRDEDVSLKIINDKIELPFKDYAFRTYAAHLAYNLGRPTKAVLELVEGMRQIARDHHEKLRLKDEECKKRKCDPPELEMISRQRRRERAAWTFATNSLTYYVAGDLVQGGKAGEGYRSRLEEFAEELRAVVKDMKDVLADDDKYSYIDSYAYATIVLEAQKKSLDLEKIKITLAELEKVVEYWGKRASDEIRADRVVINILKITRAHLSAARELANQ